MSDMPGPVVFNDFLNKYPPFFEESYALGITLPGEAISPLCSIMPLAPKWVKVNRAVAKIFGESSGKKTWVYLSQPRAYRGVCPAIL